MSWSLVEVDSLFGLRLWICLLQQNYKTYTFAIYYSLLWNGLLFSAAVQTLCPLSHAFISLHLLVDRSVSPSMLKTLFMHFVSEHSLVKCFSQLKNIAKFMPVVIQAEMKILIHAFICPLLTIVTSSLVCLGQTSLDLQKWCKTPYQVLQNISFYTNSDWFLMAHH